MFPLRPRDPVQKAMGLASWGWPTMPHVKQTLVLTANFDPATEMFKRGAHMPLMIYIGSSEDMRRTPAARARRAQRAEERGHRVGRGRGGGGGSARGAWGGWSYHHHGGQRDQPWAHGGGDGDAARPPMIDATERPPMIDATDDRWILATYDRCIAPTSDLEPME